MDAVKHPSSVAQALRLKAAAKRKRAYADEVGSGDPTGAHWERREARDMDAAADEYLDPDAHTYPRARPEVGRGGELTPVGRRSVPCGRFALHGKRRCEFHGGKSPGALRGKKHGMYKHGQRTIEAMEEQREARAVIKAAREFIKGWGEVSA